MTDLEQSNELSTLLKGLRADAAGYFARAKEALVEFVEEEFAQLFVGRREWHRDKFWEQLPGETRGEAQRLTDRLVSLMRQVARIVRNTPLASEADQRDVIMAVKVMRAALLLRSFRSWDPEVLHDEDIVLGVKPAGQSDDEPCAPEEAGKAFAEWAEKVGAILDLVDVSPSSGGVGSRETTEAARYRPGTAFIMMWMDKSQPDLVDVSDTVKSVFAQFGIDAVRADDIEHEGLITSRVVSEIKTAEFCFADLSGSRPNVYYEVGYAHALPRRVILFRKAGTGLHFDLAGYNCPEYKNLRDLREKLTERLRALTNKEPKN